MPTYFSHPSTTHAHAASDGDGYCDPDFDCYSLADDYPFRDHHRYAYRDSQSDHNAQSDDYSLAYTLYHANSHNTPVTAACLHLW